MPKTLDELEAEIEAYHKTKQYKVDQMIYKVRRFITSPLRWPRHIKHAYQRVVRGYDDTMMWNGDSYLAGQIAAILTWIVEHGHGVSMAYAESEDGFNPDVDKMVERRDADYRKYAAIFAEYRRNGLAHDEWWLAEFGGVLETDMEDALQWLKEHFYELWD